MGAQVVVTTLENPTPAQMAALAVLFDEYRVHYGEQADSKQSFAWLQDNINGGVLKVFVAEMHGELVGFATTVSNPASLRLGHYWQIKDLFVAPRCRRTGIARALLTHVRGEAEAAGALRLSLQTEADNAIALDLYRTSGFVEVDGYRSLVAAIRSGR
jgi:ribosomal protein S18 acetylase RimI-like enzyme